MTTTSTTAPPTPEPSPTPGDVPAAAPESGSDPGPAPGPAPSPEPEPEPGDGPAPAAAPASAPAAEPPPSGDTAARRTALGRYGEDVAARHLVAQGLVLLERNWRCEAGELDLVLREGDDLVVAEVKTRSSDAFGTPHEAVSEAKLARLRRLGAAWLAAHPAAHPRGVRLDLVAVHLRRRGAAEVEHVRGIG